MPLLREAVPKARRVLAEKDQTLIRLEWAYAQSLLLQRQSIVEAVREYEKLHRKSRRVLGPDHPNAKGIQRDLERARARLTSTGSAT